MYWLGAFMSASHGGARPGAGRPRFAPDSAVVRVPAYQKSALLAISRVLATAPDTHSQLSQLRLILDRFNSDNPL
jgi:hypothetical protein